MIGQLLNKATNATLSKHQHAAASRILKMAGSKKKDIRNFFTQTIPKLNVANFSSGMKMRPSEIEAFAIDPRVAALGFLAFMQMYFGHQTNFFDFRFTTKKDPADVLDFYGTEAAMELYSVFPFVCHFLMGGGEWDDDGVYRVPIPPSLHLSARIEFEEFERNLLKHKRQEDKWDHFSMKSLHFGDDDDDDDEDDDDEDEDDEGEDDEEEEGDGEGEGDDEEEEDEDAMATSVSGVQESISDNDYEMVKMLTGIQEDGNPYKLEAVQAPESEEETSDEADAPKEIEEENEEEEEEAVPTSAAKETDSGGDDDDEEEDDDDEEDEEEEAPTSVVSGFVKKERFRLMENFTCFHIFDMTVEFGFQMDDDGTLEIYHKGKHFHGLWPLYFAFLAHEWYFSWACDRYINHISFGNEDLEDQSIAYRRNIPVTVLTEILYDLTDDVVKARDWAAKNSKSTEEHETTIGDLQKLLQKAGHMNVDAITITDEKKGSQIKLNLKGKGEQKLLRRATALLMKHEEHMGVSPLQSRLSRRNSYADYQRRASKAASEKKEEPSTFTSLLQNLTTDVRDISTWISENAGDGGEEEHPPGAKKFDVNLLKRNSLVDLDRPGVKKESF